MALTVEGSYFSADQSGGVRMKWRVRVMEATSMFPRYLLSVVPVMKPLLGFFVACSILERCKEVEVNRNIVLGPL